MEYRERRSGTKPVPDDPLKYLNKAQLSTYRSMKKLGWDFKFIRRPLFQRAICVLINKEESILAVIEENGILNERPYISFRGAEHRAVEQ
jgi:hypothetical protein